MKRAMSPRVLSSLVVAPVVLVFGSGEAQAQTQTLTSSSTCTSFLEAILNDQSSSGTSNQNSGSVCSIIGENAQNNGLFTFDYGIPRSPALMLAGLSTDKITPATSLKPFVLSLPDLLGSNGTSTSAALDFAPAWAFGDTTLNSISYTKADPDTRLDRIWYRTRVGVALSKGDSGGTDPTQAKPSRAAFSVSLSLLDGSDPIATRAPGDSKSHWLACLERQKSVLEPGTPDPSTGWQDITIASADVEVVKDTGTASAIRLARIKAAAVRVNEDTSWITNTTNFANPDSVSKLSALKTKFDAAADAIYATVNTPATHDAAVNAISACKAESNDLAQHGADLQIGAGVVLQGTPGTLSDLSDPNGAVWIAGRLPFSDIFGSSGLCEPTTQNTGRSEAACWTIGGSGRYSAGEMDSTGDTTTPMFKANVAEGWIGIERIDTTMKFGGYFGYMDQSAVDAADKAFSKSGTRWLLSGAYSLSNWVNGLWVVGSYGNANGSTTTLNDKVALLSLTFGPPSLDSGFMQKNSSSQSTTSTTPPNQ